MDDEDRDFFDELHSGLQKRKIQNLDSSKACKPTPDNFQLQSDDLDFFSNDREEAKEEEYDYFNMPDKDENAGGANDYHVMDDGGDDEEEELDDEERE